MKLNKFSIHMGMFDFAVNCCVGNYKDAIEYVKFKLSRTEIDEHIDYQALGKCFYISGNRPIIWIPRPPKTTREYATLSHECLHAVFHLFCWAEMPISRDTEEVMCHAQAHLVNEFLTNLKKKG